MKTKQEIIEQLELLKEYLEEDGGMGVGYTQEAIDYLSSQFEPLVMQKIAEISIEDISCIQEDGSFEIWWWKKDTYNENWKTSKNMWEILTAKQVYDIVALGRTIEIDENIILKNFERIS